MEPRPRSVVTLVFRALLVIIMLWLIVRIVEAIWLPLLLVALIVAGLGTAGWLIYRRTRRW